MDNQKSWDYDDLTSLWNARQLLDNPGLVAKITNLVGKPIEKAIDYLPKKANDLLGESVQKALQIALKGALRSLNTKHVGEPPEASNWWHKTAVAATGGAGGLFGFPGLMIELPVTTSIMLRSIADVARSEGENLNSSNAQMACLQVLALGGSSDKDNAADIGYFAVRHAMAKTVRDAAAHIANKQVVNADAPALVRLMILIADYFGIQVTEKAAAQMMPGIGAVTGALINTLFIDHFQDMARGHFIILRLESKYGPEDVEDRYKRLAGKK